MQTTISIDDDVLTEAQRLAAKRSVSVGVVVSDLLRESLRRVAVGVRIENGFPVFDVPHGAPTITPEDVRRADEDA